jgi:hypothetical protein
MLLQALQRQSAAQRRAGWCAPQPPWRPAPAQPLARKVGRPPRWPASAAAADLAARHSSTTADASRVLALDPAWAGAFGVAAGGRLCLQHVAPYPQARWASWALALGARTRAAAMAASLQSSRAGPCRTGCATAHRCPRSRRETAPGSGRPPESGPCASAAFQHAGRPRPGPASAPRCPPPLAPVPSSRPASCMVMVLAPRVRCSTDCPAVTAAQSTRCAREALGPRSAPGPCAARARCRPAATGAAARRAVGAGAAAARLRARIQVSDGRKSARTSS